MLINDRHAVRCISDRHLTCLVYDFKVYTKHHACPVGCRNKFGMTGWWRLSCGMPKQVRHEGLVAFVLWDDETSSA
jgi:hypothetical protein